MISPNLMKPLFGMSELHGSEVSRPVQHVIIKSGLLVSGFWLQGLIY
jgi:hypothetical protein